MPKQIPVSVIIPLYNSRKLLEKHLPSVLKSLRDGDELVFIDDASQDATSNWLRYGFSLTQQKRPDLKDRHGGYELYQGFYSSKKNKVTISLVINDANLRFAASVNRAVGLASKPLLFLINSDVSVQPDTLKQLVASYQTNAQPIFAIGCLEYEGDDETAPLAGKNTLWFDRGYFRHSKAEIFESGETAWVSGGSGLFDRERWNQLGGFDERFAPAYWEDIDLSFRARKRGWQVLFEKKAVVFHQHETTNQTALSQVGLDRISWRNAGYFVRKHGTIWQKIAHVLWQPYWLIRRRKG